jgi:hypothetical protein
MKRRIAEVGFGLELARRPSLDSACAGRLANVRNRCPHGHHASDRNRDGLDAVAAIAGHRLVPDARELVS